MNGREKVRDGKKEKRAAIEEKKSIWAVEEGNPESAEKKKEKEKKRETDSRESRSEEKQGSSLPVEERTG